MATERNLGLVYGSELKKLGQIGGRRGFATNFCHRGESGKTKGGRVQSKSIIYFIFKNYVYKKKAILTANLKVQSNLVTN